MVVFSTNLQHLHFAKVYSGYGLVCTVFRLSVALLVVVYVHINITMPKTESLCWLVTSSRHGARSHRQAIDIPGISCFWSLVKKYRKNQMARSMLQKNTKIYQVLTKAGPPKSSKKWWLLLAESKIDPFSVISHVRIVSFSCIHDCTVISH